MPSRWYPTEDQVKDPKSTHRAFKQLLDQHYALQDQFDAMVKAQSATAKKSSGPPPGSGPTDTQILGLPVQPVDVQTLADGTKLTFVKKAANFQFL